MSSATETATSGTDQFVSTIVVNLVIGGTILIAFILLRREYPWIYSPRVSDHIRNPGYRSGDQFLKRPPAQPAGLFSWVTRTYWFNEVELLKTAGMDAVVTLRFLRFAFFFFCVTGFLAITIILPIQYTASSLMEGINRLSASNIPQGSNRLVTGVVILYVVMFILFAGLYELWVTNIELANRWMRREQTCGRRLTLLVEEIPKVYCDDTNFRRFWEDLYPGQIAGTSLMRETGDLADFANERNEYVKEFNHNRGLMETDFEGGFARPKAKLSKLVKGLKSDTEVDTQDYYLYHVEKLSAELACRSTFNYPVRNVGFVTFKTARTYAAAIHMCATSIPETFITEPAPEPREIRWDGISKPRRYRQILHGLMIAAHFFLVFFWVVPVSFVSSLTSLEALSARWSFLETVANLNPAIRGFLQGFLPALAMIIFMAILPLILRVMGILEGIESESKLDVFIFRRYFVFQLFNFFLVTCLAGSVLKQLDAMIESPTKVVELLASSLPQTADVFMSYILVRAFTALPLELSMLIPLAVKTFLRSFAKTPSEHLSLWTAETFSYGKALPEIVLIMVIGIAFTPLQPLMPVLCAIFFGLAYFSYKHQFIFMLVQPNETGGRHWPLVFNRILFGAVIAQLTLIGLYGLKECAPAYGLAAPLPFITFIYWYLLDGEFNSRYSSPSALDAARTDLDISSLDPKLLRRLRRGPTLNPIGVDLEPFLMPDLYNLSTEAAESAMNDAKNVIIVPKGAFVPRSQAEAARPLADSDDSDSSNEAGEGESGRKSIINETAVDPAARERLQRIAERLAAMGVDEQYIACCDEDDEVQLERDILTVFRNRLAAVDAFSPSRLRTHAADFMYTPPSGVRALSPDAQSVTDIDVKIDLPDSVSTRQSKEKILSEDNDLVGSSDAQSSQGLPPGPISGSEDDASLEGPDAIPLDKHYVRGLPALEYKTPAVPPPRTSAPTSSQQIASNTGTDLQRDSESDEDKSIDGETLTNEELELLARAREIELERRAMIRYLQPELAQELFGETIEKVTWSARYLKYLEDQYKRSHPSYSLDAVKARDINLSDARPKFVPPPELAEFYRKEDAERRKRVAEFYARKRARQQRKQALAEAQAQNNPQPPSLSSVVTSNGAAPPAAP